MKTYHLISREEFMAARECFCPRRGAHYIELPSGKLLLSAEFADSGMEQNFHDATPGKLPLPHPIYAASEPIGAEHAKELHHLFPEHSTKAARMTAAKAATVHEVIRRVSAIHPGMKLSAF